MCRPAQCSNCSKTSWIGCGLHIPTAMDGIDKDQWCVCLPENGVKGDYPPKAGTGRRSA